MMMEMARICPRTCKASRGTPSQRKVSPARRLVPALAAVLALAPVCSAPAQTDAHDLMEGRGRGVSFPISCGEDIQPRFDAALAALHSFWYGQALKEFTAISATKPDCAMAYWGIAMSVWNQIWAPPRPDNLKTGGDAIARAMAVGATTQRERDYLDALAAFYANYDKLDHRTRAGAYMLKMERVAERYPGDVEAQLFYALSLLATADGLDKTYKNQLKAGGILERVFAEKPEHPGPSHYIIHAYDYPALVDRALAAAQKYAVCVTVVPHAIHMPSHTYVLLGRWQDTITANNAAETAEADRGTPEDRIHALDYLVYAHLQLAQDRKAKEVLDLALKIENDLIARKHNSGLRARPFGVAAMEARWALERLDWTTAASLPLRPGRYPYAEAVPHFARAVGLARSGRPEQAGAEIERLAALQKGLADAKISVLGAAGRYRAQGGERLGRSGTRPRRRGGGADAGSRDGGRDLREPRYAQSRSGRHDRPRGARIAASGACAAGRSPAGLRGLVAHGEKSPAQLRGGGGGGGCCRECGSGAQLLHEATGADRRFRWGQARACAGENLPAVGEQIADSASPLARHLRSLVDHLAEPFPQGGAHKVHLRLRGPSCNGHFCAGSKLPMSRLVKADASARGAADRCCE